MNRIKSTRKEIKQTYKSIPLKNKLKMFIAIALIFIIKFKSLYIGLLYELLFLCIVYIWVGLLLFLNNNKE